MSPEALERVARLRVLWVSHGFGYNGDLMYFGEIFRALRRVMPGTTVAVDPQAGYPTDSGVTLVPLLRMMRRPITRTTPDGQVYETEIAVPSPMLLPRLLRDRAHVFVTIEFTLPALVAIVARFVSRRKRLVLLVESDPAARGGSSNPLVLWIKRWAVRRADVIQTNNVKGRRYLVEDLRAPPERVRVAPYLTSRPPGPDTVLDSASGTGPLRLLFANSLTARKGLAEFFDALALLDPAVRAQLSLTVVGDGPERTALEERAADLAMGERLRFAGRRPYAQLGPFYAAADVLVIPSLADYRSLAGFEGLGYGLVLVSSVHDGATEETVIEGETGFAVDPFDPATLAARIALLVADRERVMAMRANALALYRARFSMDVIATNLAQSIAAATGGGV